MWEEPPGTFSKSRFEAYAKEHPGAAQAIITQLSMLLVVLLDVWKMRVTNGLGKPRVDAHPVRVIMLLIIKNTTDQTKATSTSSCQ